jgi:HAD superfamily hydrolase (TIGR01509 family)
MNKKLIIWDFDGVIVDSRRLALELTQFQYENVDEDIHRNLFNGNLFESLDKLTKNNVGEEEHKEYLEKSYWPRKMELVPIKGIDEVLKNLSQDFIMVINSSSSTIQIGAYLEKYNLSHYFSKIYGNEIRDKKEKFRLILKDFNVSPENCVLVTDTLGDVLEARVINIPAVVVLWGYQYKKHFDSVSNIEFVEEPINLIEIIRNHFIKKYGN